MKELEIVIGVMLIITGAIVFELNWDLFSTVCGLIIMSVGVFFYLKAVDTLDETKEKR